MPAERTFAVLLRARAEVEERGRREDADLRDEFLRSCLFLEMT